MSDVASVCSAPIVGEVRARGLDPQILVAGLELSVAALEDPRGRIPWPDFVVFAERATKMLGEETLEELAAAATVESVPAPLRRILPRLRDSRPLFTLAARWWGPWVFHGTRGRCELLPDGRLREIVQILPEYAACPEFLSGIRGTLRAMPRLLGQPDALVTLEQDGREGEYLITPPPRRARSGAAWIRRVLGVGARRPLSPPDRDLEELGFAREQLLESKRRAQTLSVRLDAQAHRLEALRQLGILVVRDGDLDTLQGEIARLVQQQLGASGVRLTHYGGDGRPRREAASGSVAGTPAHALALRITHRNIGLLQLWGVAEDALAPLQEILPWIALALEYGGSKARVTRLISLLAEDLHDWKRIERRLEQFLAERSDALPTSRERRAGESSHELGFWVADLESIDLAQALRGLAPHLRELAGDAVRLELRCPEGLQAALAETSQLESFLNYVVWTLADLGSEEIRIETRVVPSRGHIELTPESAEILVSGRGAAMQPGVRERLLTALEISDLGLLATDLEIRSEADGVVRVGVRLPLLAVASDGRPH